MPDIFPLSRRRNERGSMTDPDFATTEDEALRDQQSEELEQRLPDVLEGLENDFPDLTRWQILRIIEGWALHQRTVRK